MNCVVIPAFRASATILPVIAAIGSEIDRIVVVDDACPEGTGLMVSNRCNDPRVVVLMHTTNQGVGGAVMTGMCYAAQQGATIIVKVDADGQMDPAQIPALIHPIASGDADYVKGNRFFFLTNAAAMPLARKFGNLALSFLAKLSTGYWTVMDPTNGFFAIHARVADLLLEQPVAQRFFFETDLLFHLGLLRARVIEFPMRAQYGDEISNLRISQVFGPFLAGHVTNTLRRILYRYFLRDFSVASVQLVLGLLLSVFGLLFGGYHWAEGVATNEFVPTGTIMIAAITLLIGFQLLLAFLNYDIGTTPREPLHPFLERGRRSPEFPFAGRTPAATESNEPGAMAPAAAPEAREIAPRSAAQRK
jgi:glycosyltransferase involved in cell wall biosynthesis